MPAGKRLAYLTGRWLMNFARDANVIPLCPEFLLFALYPHLCFSLVKRAGREANVYRTPLTPLNRVYIIARSATSASLVKIDAGSRCNHNCRGID